VKDSTLSIMTYHSEALTWKRV